MITSPGPLAGFDPTAVAEIRERLDAITREHQVRILLAIESGSRAWGFPSPDSDYDCRFVYVRKPERSFTLFPERDVIETPLTPVIDVNGWELSKALRLLDRGNAVILEWLNSPFAYVEEPVFRAEFLALAGQTCDRQAIGRHYYHSAVTAFPAQAGSSESRPLKKIFYALRPILALRWMENNPQVSFPPMTISELLRGSTVPEDIRAEIERLVRIKLEMREGSLGECPESVFRFIASSLEDLSRWKGGKKAPAKPATRHALDRFWRRWIKHAAPARQ